MSNNGPIPQLRHSEIIDTASNLNAMTGILMDGEWAIERDTGKVKWGNGVDTYANLPYQLEAASETLTTLSLASNILTYVDENGNDTDIDLSLYLDDTNLARLTSGSIDGAGLATFTRSDATTFTVDFSSLFDDTNLSRIVSGSVSGNDLILTRNDSTTITIDLSAFSPDLSDYYTATQLNTGQLDNRYYTETEINNQQAVQDTAISNNSSAISGIQTEQTTQNNNIAQNSSDITQESTDRINSDASLQSQITLNDNDILAIQNTNTSQQLEIDQNTTDNNGSVDVHDDMDISGGTSGDILTIDNGVVVPLSANYAFSAIDCWFEENGPIANNAYEWSMGNGSTGPRIGYIAQENCELYQMAINVDSGVVGTSASINIRRAVTGTQDINGSPVIATFTFTANNTIQTLATPVQITKGDILVPQTNTVVGTWSDVRIFPGLRVLATSSAAKTVINAIGGNNISFNSTAFIDIPGISSTVTLTRPGTLIGDLIFSAARSGAANAEAQFRVVINGDNGQIYNETLSTFNDTGSAFHFLDNIPAGTYTISGQALTSQPILIASVGLRLTAKED